MKPTTRHNGFSQPSYPLRKKRREKETNRKKREAEKRKEIDRKEGLKEHGSGATERGDKLGRKEITRNKIYECFFNTQRSVFDSPRSFHPSLKDFLSFLY